MEFTYTGYEMLLARLKNNKYIFTDYHSWQDKDKAVILRHDIDYDLTKAIPIAKIENTEKVKSTYFVLLTSDFYNVFSMEGNKYIEMLMDLGHEIGLHFDEARYPNIVGDAEAIKDKILCESSLLEQATGCKISTVSMHRPSKAILEADLKLTGKINSYGAIYFNEFKYLSDSRRRWREPIDEIIDEGNCARLHILTHPFWYNESEIDIHDSVTKFVKRANRDRYESIRSNITDIDSIMDGSEVL